MIQRLLNATILALLVAGSCRAAPADGAGNPPPFPDIHIVDRPAGEKDVFTFNYGVPTSPALDLIGLSPDKMTTSTALKPFVLQLPASVGTIQSQSVGLDVAPGWLIDPLKRTSEAYLRDEHLSGYLHRLAFRTHFGLAVSQGAGNADPTKAIPSKLGIGVSAALLPNSDPLTARFNGQSKSAWLTCVDAASKAVLADLGKPSPPDPTTAALQQQEDKLFDQVAALRRQSNEKQASVASLTAAKQAALKALDDSLAAPHLPPADAAKLRDARLVVANTFDARIDEATADRASLEAQIDKLIQQDDPQLKLSIGKARDAANLARQSLYAKTTAAKAVDDCANQAALAARYAPDLQVGVGSIWNGPPGRVGSLTHAGTVVWAAYKTSLGRVELDPKSVTARVKNYWMVGGSLRASWAETVSTGDKTHPLANADIVDGWLGLERITDVDRLSLQAGYQSRKPQITLPAFERDRWRYFFSYSRSLSFLPGAWLLLGYGDTSDTSARKNQAVTLTVTFTQPKATSDFGTK